MSPAPDPPVRFGAFELDLRTGELRKAGVRVNLPEQPFQVLRALLDRPGGLVTREELRQRLWPSDTFVDFEHGLNAAVRRLRDALGDSADVPRFVETLPRRGYRFIAPLAEAATVDASAPVEQAVAVSPEPASAAPMTPPRRTRAWASGSGLAAASTIATAAALWISGLVSWPPGTPEASHGRFLLAAIPCENLNRNPEQEYLGAGMSEELSVRLGRLDPANLSVIARGSVTRLKTLDERGRLGAKRGVSHELTCSILTSESGIRIIAKLIDAQSERQLWGDTYDGEAKDSLRFLSVTADAIAGQVASHLRIAWSTAADYTVTYSKNDEANRDYLRGRHHLAKDDRENLAKAEKHFLNAIQLDDTFAQAYAGLADVYILMGSDGFLTMESAYKRAREAATTALRINRKLTEAHTSLAAIAGDYDWDWDEAERHLKAAVDQDGGYEPSARLYSFYLACMGRADEARRFAEHALRLAPASAQASMNLAVVHYFARHYPEAISVLEEVTLDLEPEFGPAYVMLGRIYVAQGLHERAIEKLQHARRLMGARPDVVTPLAYVLARANRRREALEAAEELKRISAPGMPSPFRMAMVDIGLGNMDGAFAGLQRAFAAHDWQVTLLKVEPAFDALRADKRFEDLLDQVGLSRR